MVFILFLAARACTGDSDSDRSDPRLSFVLRVFMALIARCRSRRCMAYWRRVVGGVVGWWGV